MKRVFEPLSERVLSALGTITWLIVGDPITPKQPQEEDPWDYDYGQQDI